MYWTDSMFDRVEVSKLDGSDRKVLFSTRLINPRSIVVYPEKGYAYVCLYTLSKTLALGIVIRVFLLNLELFFPNERKKCVKKANRFQNWISNDV